jgi:SWI/SNF-related matrix-associated actin-dependent regulator of chromatin subfamily A-like protein 1
VIITYWKGVFVVDKPDERGALRKAGFELHEPTLCKKDGRCKACRANIGNRFWSDKVESATRLKSYCNERALTVMKSHLDKLARSRAVDANIVVPCNDGLAYLPFQKAGIAYMRDHKDTLLGDEMGVGKTIQALGFVNYLKPKNVLCVCPSTLSFNWRNEAVKWLVDGREIVIPRSGQSIVPGRDNLFVIVNYEKLIADSPLTRSLARIWDVLICDEAHALKTPDAQRTQAILGESGLMRRAHRCLFLTGTPIENYPKEIWTIAAAICPAKFGNWIEFAHRYCGLRRQGGRTVDTGATHLGELQQRLRASFMIRRRRADVLAELPPKRRQLVVLGDSEIDWSQDPDFQRWKQLYDADYEARLAKLEAAQTAEEYKAAIKSLDDFIGVAFQDMSEFRHKTALAKLPACISYIDDVLASGIDKLVIFAHHQDVLGALAEHYGPEAVSLHGDTPKPEREKAVKRFQEGDARIFIGGLKTAVGFNLHAASTCILVEVDWNPSIVSQAEDRLARIGQKKMVHVIHLVLDGTIDVNMSKRIIAKQEVLDKVLNRHPEHGMGKRSPDYQPVQLKLAV